MVGMTKNVCSPPFKSVIFLCMLFALKHDLQSQKFKDLKGENRELVLAAAHIEDAKTGR